ncbi:Holliday junction branch migration DNA helicase RuvB [Candidatus Gottesmanbacteria bacterium]|nr:Holliday junction branch migration DNA helicase RuvB [Candidatus Gottesmanbacteria bacterium]
MKNKLDKTTKIDTQTPEEEILFVSLRASRWDEFYGQDKIKQSISIAIEAARKRKEALEHVLLYGPPGLGKTTLAHLIAKEMRSNIRITSGPAIVRTGDLAAILTNLEPYDILFIDEIHRLNKAVEETLYPAMEDFKLDIIIGKGPSARTLRLDLSPFTIVGATTRIGLLSAPLRDRFGIVHHLPFYQHYELKKIITTAANKLSVPIDSDSLEILSRRARGTPRIGLKLLKRSRDYAQIKGQGRITTEIINKSFDMLGIDEKGLDEADRRLLLAIIEKHGGGPVGIETLAASLSEDIGTLEEVIEPYLLQLGFLKRSPRGRVATKHAFKHLKVPYQEEKIPQQNKLL